MHEPNRVPEWHVSAIAWRRDRQKRDGEERGISSYHQFGSAGNAVDEPLAQFLKVIGEESG